jgi:hypothetical protein
MKDAALRYSPEMALAFQPTETLRPATKKSEAVFDRRADQKPTNKVATTVTALKVRIQGSTVRVASVADMDVGEYVGERVSGI